MVTTATRFDCKSRTHMTWIRGRRDFWILIFSSADRSDPHPNRLELSQ
jgi:hypothetical protein